MSEIDWRSLRTAAKKATELLPDDWYDAQVVKSEATTASTGSPMIKVTLEVTDGGYAGRRLFDQFVISDNGFALSMFFRRMAAFGLTDEVFDSLGNAGHDAVANMLMGRSVRVKVGKDEWPRGQNPPSYRNRVEEYAPAGVAAGLPGVPVGGGAPVPSTPSTPATPPTPPTPPSGAGASTPPNLPF